MGKCKASIWQIIKGIYLYRKFKKTIARWEEFGKELELLQSKRTTL